MLKLASSVFLLCLHYKNRDLREPQHWHTHPWATHQWVCWRKQSCRVSAMFLSGLSDSQSRCKQTWGLLSIAACELRISMSSERKFGSSSRKEKKKKCVEEGFYTNIQKVVRRVIEKWRRCESISWCVCLSILFGLVLNISSSLYFFFWEPSASSHSHESSSILPSDGVTKSFLAINHH